MNSYNKQALNIIANEQGFIRDNLEKVMRLVEILNYFHYSPLLSTSLVLKGGTAINLTVFQLPRLSVDIYLTVGSSRKDNDTPIEFVEFPQIDKIRFPHIRSQLLPVLRRSEHFDFEKAKVEVKDFLKKLLVLTDSEKEFVRNFNDREYLPELLLEDKDIVNRIKFHPMALWKTGSR